MIQKIVFAMLMFTCIALPAQNRKGGHKMLVAYFSHSGNTRTVAQAIGEATGADLFEIIPQQDYPTDYGTLLDVAKREINAHKHPDLKERVKDFEAYDVIFIGSPNWWSTVAPPVVTFMKSYDFSGKTIVPFMTHGGGRFGHAIDDLKALCPGATFLDGLSVRDGSVSTCRPEVDKWLKRLNLLK